MKQTLLIVFLGLGLLALSACGLSNKERSVPIAEKAGAPEQKVAVGDSVMVDGSYQVNVTDSKLAWRGTKIVGNSHTGIAPLRSGSLLINGGHLSGGELIIDLSALKSEENIEALENHLKSADFFEVTAYPEAKLEIT